ncbi:hypothetical protein F8388_025567 [Cannabis sativa]|uniref:Uncharacterized protein n=1 Tax=Cannabis sativa TaxID=3483 RepID=A0A7J6G169_CANSA|nr:hypothetical protein F8388_025567 [Cannabis sativa]
MKAFEIEIFATMETDQRDGFCLTLPLNYVFDGVEVINWSGIPSAMSIAALFHQAKVVVVASYASITVFGYLMLGSGVQSQITLDLPIEKLSSKIAIYTTLVNPIAKYALIVTVLVS